MICVIGSGPAAVACIAPLVAKGVKVRVLDIGNRLDQTTVRRVESLAGQMPSQWNQSDIANIKGNMDFSTKGIPLKLSFGSDFPYHPPSLGTQYEGKDVGSLPSFALGGLSNVWGAAMLPYRDADILTWPIHSEELAPHYEAIANLTGLAARGDDLAKYFPLYSSHIHSVDMSTQAQSFLKDLERSRHQLHNKGIIFGQSRLAFIPSLLRPDHQCQSCTLCMYGCPYGVIFNSATLINHWIASGAIEYMDQRIVGTVQEAENEVIVSGTTTQGKIFEERFRNVSFWLLDYFQAQP